MGQAPLKASSEFRYIQEGDCFRRRILLIDAPRAAIEESFKHSTERIENGVSRLFRSVSVQRVLWKNTGKLLPEQWQTILGNQLCAFQFVSWRLLTLRNGKDVFVLAHPQDFEQKLRYIAEKLRSVSPDAPLLVVQWDIDSNDYEYVSDDEAKELLARTGPAVELMRKRREKHRSRQPAPVVDDDTEDFSQPHSDPPVSDDESEDDDKEDDSDDGTLDDDALQCLWEERALLQMNDSFLEAIPSIVSSVGVTHVRVRSRNELFSTACLVSMRLVPMELSRPLCGLLFQLRDACSATEAFLLDAVTMLPLISTLDVDPSGPDHYLHATTFALQDSLQRLMKAFSTDLHFLSIPVAAADSRLVVGWACKPYAYVMLLLPNSGGIGRASQLLIEKNMETAAMHFYNVINNTSLTRSFVPIQ